MRTVCKRRSPGKGRPRGFTLMELLVTLLLIGIILTFASLSLGDGGREERLATEARRIAALLDLASEQAVLENRDYAVQFFDKGYRFAVRSRGQWMFIDDDVFRPRVLQPEMGVALALERMPVRLGDRPPEEAKPHLLLLSSGERTPFELRIAASDGRAPFFDVIGELMGKPRLIRKEAP